jgi:hypothetical protein
MYSWRQRQFSTLDNGNHCVSGAFKMICRGYQAPHVIFVTHRDTQKAHIDNQCSKSILKGSISGLNDAFKACSKPACLSGRKHSSISRRLDGRHFHRETRKADVSSWDICIHAREIDPHSRGSRGRRAGSQGDDHWPGAIPQSNRTTVGVCML